MNNTRSGLDVDKLDYFQRDMRFSNVTFAANFERFIELGRVIRATPVTETDGTKFTRRHSGGWVASQSEAEPASSVATSPAQHNCHSHSHMQGQKKRPALENTDGYQLMVCYPQKVVFEAIDLFSVRFRMHKTVYTHKAVKQVEFMITDILRAANDYIKIKGAVTDRFPEGMYRISECVFCMEALSNLNDSVIEMVRYDQNPALAKAKSILRRLESRQLYICLGKSPYTRDDVSKGIIKSEETMTRQMCEISKNLCSGHYDGPRALGLDDNNKDARGVSEDVGNVGKVEVPIEPLREDQELLMDPGNSQDSFYSVSECQNNQFPSNQEGGSDSSADGFGGSGAAGLGGWQELEEQDIIVEKMHIHYGLKDKNPVSRMRFFPKLADSDTVGTQIKDRVYHTSMPTVFEEFAVRVFCRTQGKEATARKAFQIWCKEKLCLTPFQTDGGGAVDDDEAVSQV